MENDGTSQLHVAVQKGSTKDIVLILSKGADVNAKGEDNITPLHIAAKKGYIDIARYLLEHGACIHSLTLKERYSPLHFAAEQGNEEAVKLFLNMGADVNATTHKKLTPLHIATKVGNIMIVRLLLQHGGKVDSQDKYGKTILYLAVDKGYLTIAEEVLKYRPDVNNVNNRRSLNIAVDRYGDEYKDMVGVLLDYGLTVYPKDANNTRLLHEAVKKGYLKIVEDFMKYGTDVNALYNLPFKECFTPLHCAVEKKQEEVAKLLISYGADINGQDKTGKTPIFYAIYNGDLNMTKLLLANRANVKDNHQLLNVAVKKGCIEIVEYILQHGANINGTDEYGRTALHYTAATQSESSSLNNKEPNIHIKREIAKILLSKGADAEVKDKLGKTPLHVASFKDNIEVLNVLLEYGAKVESKMNNYMTPLHMGAYGGYREVIKTLLKFGADINAKDGYGRTALHFASHKGHLEVVETLLEYDADINMRSNIYGRTPLNKDGVMKYYKLVRNNIRSGYECHHYRCICTCKVTAETLTRHVVKLNAANLCVSERNLQLTNFWYGRSDFVRECGKEIIALKSEKINNTNITFYDILTKSTNSIAIYARNENIVQVLKGDDYKTEFPIYASIIKNHFRKGIARKELIEQCNKIAPFLFNSLVQLPYNCTEEICSYLNNEDIKVLMEACKSFSIIHPND